MLRILTCLFFFSGQQEKDTTLSISLEAFNLSEDKSVLSTQNDEIIFQIYEYNQQEEILDQPVLIQSLLFDESNRKKAVDINQALIYKQRDYYIFLVEYDYEKTSEQRVPIYRIYHQQILSGYQSKNQKELQKYLGSDDLLGCQLLSGRDILNGLTIPFEGILNFEKYHYELKFISTK